MSGSITRHLFNANRPRQCLLAQYQLAGGSLSGAAHVAVPRRRRDNGTVEIPDVTDISAAVVINAEPMVISIAMSSRPQNAVLQRWKPLLRRAGTSTSARTTRSTSSTNPQIQQVIANGGEGVTQPGQICEAAGWPTPSGN